MLDPPRTGVSPAALDAVISLRTPRLVYVSCDPATLARDSARLVASGYNLTSLRAFDLFPNTAHVEAVAGFEMRMGSGLELTVPCRLCHVNLEHRTVNSTT